MGQREIIIFLESERKINDNWFSANQIREGIKNNGTNLKYGIYDDLMKLSLFSLIDCKGEGLWNHKKLFRGKA